MSDTGIRMRDVSKRYDGKRVIERFRCELNDGEVAVLMGPSGSGKTTLLRLMAGLEAPDEGTVEREGRVGMVFQEDRLVEHASALANLTLVGVKEETARTRLRALGLDPNARVATMSGGMKRRVALARALAFECELLLLDEPFKGLDFAWREEAARTVTSLARGRLIVLVTHDEREAALLGANRILRIGEAEA